MATIFKRSPILNYDLSPQHRWQQLVTHFTGVFQHPSFSERNLTGNNYSVVYSFIIYQLGKYFLVSFIFNGFLHIFDGYVTCQQRRLSGTNHNQPSSAGPVYIKDLNLLITVPADGLAPIGARPSAGTVLIENSALFSVEFIPYHHCRPRWHHSK